MTQQLDVARGRDVVARWCALAEQRLEHLTELFETGRWRRYHSELAFLENIQEAKVAVQTWRDLSRREASRNNTAVDISGAGHTGTPLAFGERWGGPVQKPQLAAIPADAPPSIISIVPQAEPADPEEISAAPVSDDFSELTQGIAAAVAERYPQLRNAL